MTSVFRSLAVWARAHPRSALTLLTLALYLSGTHVLPLMDRDEPRFATATREMAEAMELVVPTFNGQERLDKPILIYWMMQLTTAVFGHNEFAARLPSVLCMLALVLFLHHWARRWYGAEAGLVAGLVTATTLQFLIHGRWAAADMPMILALTVAHYGLFGLLGLAESDAEKKARDFGHQDWSWFWIFYGALGLGFLAKGPLVWVVPALTLFLHRMFFWRRDVDWERLHFVRGFGLVFAIIAVWGMPALIQTNWRFLTTGIGSHVLERGVDPFGGRMWIPGFYLLTIFASLMPWIAFAGAIRARFRIKWTAREAYLVSWFVAVLALFSIYATQLPHYILPAFPAFSLLMGALFCGGEIQMKALDRGTRWFWSVIGIYGVLIAALMVIAPMPIYEGQFIYVGTALAAAILLIGGLVAVATSLWYRGPWVQFYAGLFAVVVALWTVGISLRRTNPAAQLADYLSSRPDKTRFVAWRFTEGTLIYYSGEKWDLKLDRNEFGAFRDELQKPGPVVGVMVAEEMDLGRWITYSIRKRFGGNPEWPARAFPEEVEAAGQPEFRRLVFEGFNPGRSRWVKVVVLERK